jgi:hypothetical protein
MLLAALKAPTLGLKDIKDENIEFYSAKLTEAKEMKKVYKVVFGPNK